MSQSWRLTTIISLVCCALAAAIALLIRPVSDDSLAKRFRQQRAEIDRLVSILASDPTVSFVQRHAESNHVLLITDGTGRTRAAAQFGPVAVELRRLFDLIGCDYVSRSASEIIIAPRRSSIEDLYPGGFKVFALRTTKPDFVVGSIDGFRRRNRGKYGVYQQLEAPWYIKYEEAH